MDNILKIKTIQRRLADYTIEHAANVTFYHTYCITPNVVKIKMFDSTVEKWYTIEADRIENVAETIKNIIRDFEARRMDVTSLYPSVMPKLTAETKEYIRNDIESTINLYEEAKSAFLRYSVKQPQYIYKLPEISDVIFNNPAIIVFWTDGTKTVVKADNEEFDPEKGLAMAIAKKALGNKHDYYETFKKWIGKYNKKKAKEIQQ